MIMANSIWRKKGMIDVVHADQRRMWLQQNKWATSKVSSKILLSLRSVMEILDKHFSWRHTNMTWASWASWSWLSNIWGVSELGGNIASPNLYSKKEAKCALNWSSEILVNGSWMIAGLGDWFIRSVATEPNLSERLIEFGGVAQIDWWISQHSSNPISVFPFAR